MDIDVKPGLYVVAVSGGVDSVTLLHILHTAPGLQLIVAHYDHGIRPDSSEDRRLVERTAKAYGLPFISEDGQLGPGVSEAIARTARYSFLERVRVEHHAAAIITAHHQDDTLETALLNLLRGTGRKGLTSLANRRHVLRPLLPITKQTLIMYAEEHSLVWREDSTNRDGRYLRNYIRHQLLPRFSAASKAELLALLEQTRQTNQTLDAELTLMLRTMSDGGSIDRHAFHQLPYAVAKEMLASWLRANGVNSFDRHTIERVTVAAKTGAPGAIIDIIGGASLHLTKDSLALVHPER